MTNINNVPAGMEHWNGTVPNVPPVDLIGTVETIYWHPCLRHHSCPAPACNVAYVYPRCTSRRAGLLPQNLHVSGSYALILCGCYHIGLGDAIMIVTETFIPSVILCAVAGSLVCNGYALFLEGKKTQNFTCFAVALCNFISSATLLGVAFGI